MSRDEKLHKYAITRHERKLACFVRDVARREFPGYVIGSDGKTDERLIATVESLAQAILCCTDVYRISVRQDPDDPSRIVLTMPRAK